MIGSDPYTHPRDALLAAMERIYRHRMTTTSGGNLSIRDDDGSIWITPARVDKGGLRRDDIARVRPEGTSEGPHRPSSELPFHRAIYAARPDLRAIVHAHPVALVAFSVCRRVPETKVLPATWRVCGTVGFAPYALPGSDALGRSIAETFAQGHNCVVLENHGVVTAGGTLQEAFERFETLEFCAKTHIKAALLGPARTLEDGPAAPWAGLEEGPRRLDAPPSAEREIRRQLAEFVRRAYRQRLMISTQGAFSARLDAGSFLITPHRIDRGSLEPRDLVLVREGVAEAGGRPSSSAAQHAAIYAEHPGVGAVVNAYPVNATAFSLTTVELDTRTIPESYVFLREVRRVPFAESAPASLVSAVSMRHPAALLENNGVIVCGSTVLDAFDRLEVLESTAEALINSRPLGELVPMPPEAIQDLRTAFGLD
jgi:L-fuculose-phosphate aldolase